MDTSVADPVTAYRSDRAYSTSEDDSDNEEKCWKRQATDKARTMVTSSGYDFAKSSAVAGEPHQEPLFGRKRKVNNVWSAVANEDLLTEDLCQVSVASADKSLAQDRECESYDYTRRELDTRPKRAEPDVPIDEEESVTTYDVVDILDPGPRGTKRSFMDRVGERTCTRPSRSRRPKDRGAARARRSKSDSSKSGSSERDEDSVAEVVTDIAKRLQEPKVELVERAVTILGIPQCLKLLGMTEDIESSGGLMVLDKSRRRTPGGVFFYLIRTHMPRRQAQLVFAEENQERERMRKKFRREQSRMTREKHVALAAAAVPLDYSPTREEERLDGGSEPMADQEPGTSLSAAEPMVAADEAAEESSEDCQIVYIEPMAAADDTGEDSDCQILD